MAVDVSLGYGKVVCLLLESVADGPDPDDIPDLVAADLRPTLQRLTTNEIVNLSTPSFGATTARLKTGTYQLGVMPDGHLTDDVDSLGGVLPTAVAGVWLAVGQWRINFGGGLKSQDFWVTTEHTDANPLDLGKDLGYVPPIGVTVRTVALPSGGQPGQVYGLNSDGSLGWYTPTMPIRERATVATHGTADNITENGVYPVTLSTDAAGLGLPSANNGELRVINIGTQTNQQFWALEAEWQVYLRRKSSGVWSEWEAPFKKLASLIDSKITTATAPLITRFGALEKTRKAYIALSRSGGTSYVMSGPGQWTQRQPFRVGAPVDSFRIHFRNFEERTSTAYAGTVDITGVWIGEAEVNSSGSLTGQFKPGAPVTKVSDAFSLPADGTGSAGTALIFNSTLKLVPHVEYIISYGITASGATIHRSQGRSWFTTSTSNASQATVGATLNPSTFSILNSWVEVNGRAPRLAIVGDSHIAGGAADHPVYESLPNYLGWSHGFVPINAGAGGSTLAEWSTSTDYKWSKFSANQVSADAWILALGQNDIYGAGETIANMKSQFATVAAIGKSVFGPNMYVSTVMPRNVAGQEAQNALRLEWNNWLRTLPHRAIGCLDFAEQVTTADGNSIDSRYLSADNTHLNSAGNSRIAMGVTISVTDRPAI